VKCVHIFYGGKREISINFDSQETIKPQKIQKQIEEIVKISTQILQKALNTKKVVWKKIPHMWNSIL